MYNLFEPTAAAEIISRIEKLQPNSQARWGKMNVAQMLAHCQAPFEVYFGEKKMKQSLIGIFFGRIAKRKLFSDQPWKKNLPTAKEFKVAGDREFINEKNKLVGLINRFSTEGYNITTNTHPFFGKMSSQEWALLGYKHMDHHLQQFGV